jgi:hypothetical protein
MDQMPAADDALNPARKISAREGLIQVYNVRVPSVDIGVSRIAVTDSPGHDDEVTASVKSEKGKVLGRVDELCKRVGGQCESETEVQAGMRLKQERE